MARPRVQSCCRIQGASADVTPLSLSFIRSVDPEVLPR